MRAVGASATSITVLALGALFAAACGKGGGTDDAGMVPSGNAGSGGSGGGGAGSGGGSGRGGSSAGGGGGGSGGSGGGVSVAPARGRIAAGLDWNCAIAEAGSLTCWGAGVTSSPPPGSYSFVAAGQDAMCAVDAAGAVTCWARSATASIRQVVIGGASSTEFACGLRTDGEPVCWRNSDVTAMPALTTPPAGAHFRDIAAGSRFACGVGLDGAVSCWGTASEASLTGIPTGTFLSIATGATYACASVAMGAPRCWGLAPQFESSFGPPAEVVQLAASRSNTNPITCALLKDGRVFCLRSDATSYATPPAPVPAFNEIAAGASHVCGVVAADRSVVCWSDSAKPAIQVPSGLRVPAR